MWAKYKCYDKGISPREVDKMKIKDLFLILDIDNAIKERMKREQDIQNKMAKMKRGGRW